MPHRSESLIEKVPVHQKIHTFTLNSMVPALRKNAQETGLRLCPFSNMAKSCCSQVHCKINGTKEFFVSNLPLSCLAVHS